MDTTAIIKIFTDAATDIGTMLVPIMQAGVVIFIAIVAFKIGKKIFKSSTN